MITSIVTADGVSLECAVDAVADADGRIVVCHPHPEHGGTMRHPMLVAIVREANRLGYDTVRFNFRGVGASTGTHDGGEGELLDIDAAVALATEDERPLIGIAGWSFGAAAALAWQARARSTAPYVGIAPPVDSPLSPRLPPATALEPARRTFIVGDRDQFVDADELETYGDSIGATTLRYPTADHFFLLRHDRLAADVLEAITSKRPSPEGA